MPSADEEGGRKFLRNVRLLVATYKEIELRSAVAISPISSVNFYQTER
jgi:hypothetical protein